MNWKELTDDLYKKISPLGGDLYSQIDWNYIKAQKIISIWIEFDMNEFMYVDPLYGEQPSTAPFRMFVNPLEGASGIEIRHIQDLENKTITDPETYKGSFSNSLHFSVPMIRFGKINNKKIGFEMEYCFTRDSLGFMDGSINQAYSSGRISVDLRINDMLILVEKNKDVKKILRSMDPNIYDLKSVKEATDTNVVYNDYDQYRVPYKDLQFNLKQNKPWWRLKPY